MVLNNNSPLCSEAAPPTPLGPWPGGSARRRNPPRGAAAGLCRGRTCVGWARAQDSLAGRCFLQPEWPDFSSLQGEAAPTLALPGLCPRVPPLPQSRPEARGALCLRRSARALLAAPSSAFPPASLESSPFLTCRSGGRVEGASTCPSLSVSHHGTPWAGVGAQRRWWPALLPHGGLASGQHRGQLCPRTAGRGLPHGGHPHPTGGGHTHLRTASRPPPYLGLCPSPALR